MLGPSVKWPFGTLALAAPSALRTVSKLMPYLFNCVGFSSSLTPGRALPPTVTWPTPAIWESFCAITVEAASYIWPLVRTLEVRPTMKMGESAGLALGEVGVAGGVAGRE